MKIQKSEDFVFYHFMRHAVSRFLLVFNSSRGMRKVAGVGGGVAGEGGGVAGVGWE